MARSRSLAACFLITRMFMFLLICLDNTNAAMGYDLLCVPCMSMHCTHSGSFIKSLKIQINFKGRRKCAINFPEGERPLRAGVTSRTVSKPQAGLG